MGAEPPSLAAEYEGGCHCGAIRFNFQSARPLAPRACQCSFCRKHAARTVSDSDGRASIVSSLREAEALYRFATKQADYLVCPHCGVYVGAAVSTPSSCYCTLNLNSFSEPHPELPASPVSYEGEGPEGRARRRLELWTPCVIRFGVGSRHH